MRVIPEEDVQALIEVPGAKFVLSKFVEGLDRVLDRHMRQLLPSVTDATTDAWRRGYLTALLRLRNELDGIIDHGRQYAAGERRPRSSSVPVIVGEDTLAQWREESTQPDTIEDLR